MTAELPPLARGRAETTICPIDPSGITPARAGKSADRTARHCGHGNYPRSRGEENTRGKHLHIFRELPPLARGREYPGQAPPHFQGITPARAGKSQQRSVQYCAAWNYPCSRGEETRSRPFFCESGELPPLARGRGTWCQGRVSMRGITPARAGKRRHDDGTQATPRNYPRSRGEESYPRPCRR